MARSVASAVAVLVWFGGNTPLAAAPLYKVGDIVENFSLVNRATGQPMQLTDFAGKIVLLDWFAWWCPFCQAAAPQLLTGIDQWYDSRGGNPDGIPVVHVGVNLQPNEESQTQNFVNRAKFPLVLEDYNRKVANRIALSGQPIFAIINCVTNSPNHKPWELLYSRLGYGQTSFPVATFRAAIDSVKAPVAAPPSAPVLSSIQIQADGSISFVVTGAVGSTYRLDRTTDLRVWNPVKTYSAANAVETVTVAATPGSDSSVAYFRVVIP